MSANRPNVLLFITDQQRHDTLGYTGRYPNATGVLHNLVRDGGYSVLKGCLGESLIIWMRITGDHPLREITA